MPIVTYPGPGCIVEFIEANVPQIALVTEEQGGKLRVFLPNRRETRLSINRLLPWSGPIVTDTLSKEKNVQILETHRLERKKISENISIIDVWELAQGEVEKATAQWFAELFEQDPSIDTIAAYGHALLQCKSHFRFQSTHFEIFSNETVQMRLAEQQAQQQRERLICEGANFFRILWDVWSKKIPLPSEDNSNLWPRQDIAEILKNILLSRIADPEGSEHEVIWRSLVKGLPYIQHMALHLATAWGLVAPHHNFWLDRAGYAPGDDWSKEYSQDIDIIIDSVNNGQITQFLPFISIDSATTKDIDDAFYIDKDAQGNYIVQLALACPALLWPFGTAFDKNILHRSTSIYLPEATYHMLPEILGTDVLSLIAHKIRPSLCVRIEVSNEGDIINCTPTIQWIKLAANLVYEDCENILESKGENVASPYREKIFLASELAVLRQKRRIANGAVVMERFENKITLEGQDSDIHVNIEDLPPSPKSQLLVSEMMVLASTAMASWAKERDIPLLYRTQDVALPKEYAGIWSKAHDISRIIKSLTPSILELIPKPHAGLAVNAYAPITSPLRRYADLINEAQVLHFLTENSIRWSKEYLEKLLPLIHIYSDAAGQVQRFRPRYWRLQYMRQEGDKKFWDAIVTEENDNFATVSIPAVQLIVRGKRHLFGERTFPGQEVQVRIGKVNALYNEITILETLEM